MATDSVPSRVLTTRSVLVIAHGFPPASGSGSNRALAMARYLPAHGWRPVLLTPGTAWAANRDDRLLAEVPHDLAVVRTRSLEGRPGPRPGGGAIAPGGTASAGGRGIVRTLKGHLGHLRRFPDAHVGWTPFAVAAGLRVARRQGAGALYTSSGPFTSHVVGLLLHRLTGLPWVAELRDGWYAWNRAIFPDYPAWRDRLERRLEGAVIRQACRVVLVTEAMAEAFRRQYPDLPPNHFATVYNGFDPAQYAGLPRGVPDSDRFEIVHAGSIYYGRSIDAFLEAARRLAAEDRRFAECFRLRLLGVLDESARAEIGRRLADGGLAGRVRYDGYVDHVQALADMRAANALLLLVNTTPGAEATIPAKLFEYLAVGRPVLAIVPPGAEAGAIVRSANAGWVAAAHDPDSVLTGLREAFAAHLAGAPFQPDAAAVAHFDRQVQAGALARCLDEVAGR